MISSSKLKWLILLNWYNFFFCAINMFTTRTFHQSWPCSLLYARIISSWLAILKNFCWSNTFHNLSWCLHMMCLFHWVSLRCSNIGKNVFIMSMIIHWCCSVENNQKWSCFLWNDNDDIVHYFQWYDNKIPPLIYVLQMQRVTTLVFLLMIQHSNIIFLWSSFYV